MLKTLQQTFGQADRRDSAGAAWPACARDFEDEIDPEEDPDFDDIEPDPDELEDWDDLEPEPDDDEFPDDEFPDEEFPDDEPWDDESDPQTD